MFGPMINLAAATLIAAAYPQIDILIFYIGTVLNIVVQSIFLATLPFSKQYLDCLAISLALAVSYGIVVSMISSPTPKDHRDSPMSKPHIFFAGMSSVLAPLFLSVLIESKVLNLFPGSDLTLKVPGLSLSSSFTAFLELGVSLGLLWAAFFISGSRAARHYYDNSRYSTILYHSLIIGSSFPVLVFNPVFNPIYWIEHHQEQLFQSLGQVFLCLFPIFLMNRYVEGYVFDFSSFNDKIQKQGKNRPTPAFYYK